MKNDSAVVDGGEKGGEMNFEVTEEGTMHACSPF